MSFPLIMKVDFVYNVPTVAFGKKQTGKPYKLNYDQYDNLMTVKYSRPIRLEQALRDLSTPVKPTLNKKLAGVAADQQVMKRFLDDLYGQEILKTKVTEIIGRGSVAVAFKTEDDKVLKLTNGNHFHLNRPVEEFDAPVYLKGHYGKTYYYLEEYCPNYGLSDGFVDIVSEKIKQKGYRVYDMGPLDVHQIGMSKEGKLYLVDHECAKYKTVFHKIFSFIKNKF